MIRKAAVADMDEIMRLLVAFHAENGLAPLDPEKVIAVVGDSLENDLLFVAGDKQGLVGALLIRQTPFWYSRESELRDFAFYVEPAFRDLNIGAELVNAAKAEAKARELPLTITVTNPRRAGARGIRATLEGFFPIGWVTRFN